MIARIALLALLALPLAARPFAAAPVAAPSATEPPDFTRAIAAARAGDTGTAAALFLALARTGNAEAQFNLALLFYDGRGLPQNHAEALYWAWRARLAGRPEAPALIARMAEAATPDLRKTLATRIAADLDPRIKAGEERAMLELSFVLLDILPEPDLTTAYVWQALAAAFETPNAVTARNRTYARLDATTRPKAQTQAMEQLHALCQSGLATPVCTELF